MDERPKVKWLDENCHTCGDQLNSWDARISKALGYRNKVCEECIARQYDLEVADLRERMEDFFDMRPCAGI